MAQGLGASGYYASQSNLGESSGLRRQGPLTVNQRLPLGTSPAHIHRSAFRQPVARVASPAPQGGAGSAQRQKLLPSDNGSSNGSAMGESQSSRRRHRVSLRSSSGGRKRLTREEVEKEKARAAAAAAAAARSDGAPPYSAEDLARKWSRQPGKVISRALDITLALGSVAAGILADRQTGQLQRNMRKRAIELRMALTRLGPTFVKLGQALSTRPDLCPPEYLDELATLQDSLPTFPDAEAFACIERELGAPLEDLFESISPKPIAAASLGQVYQAVTRRGAQRLVAVKVQRPGIETAVGIDFYLLRGLLILVDKYVDSLKTSLVALLDEFAKRVYQELDYVQEGRNAERFAALYGDQSGVYVPEVLWECTSTKVLTMEWIEGVKLSDAARLAQRNLKMLDLVDIGIQCSLRQLLEFGYFHADPHPGNLLAMQVGSEQTVLVPSECLSVSSLTFRGLVAIPFAFVAPSTADP